MSRDDKKFTRYGRPRLDLPRSGLEIVLDLTSLIITVLIWVYLIYAWKELPNRIPTHFGFSGVPDAWGGKGSLLFLPIMGTGLYLLLTIIKRFPQSFNYLVTITEENAQRQYKNVRTMMSWLTVELAILFFFLEYQSVLAAQSGSSGLGVLFLPVYMIIVFGTIGVYIYRMAKMK